MIFAETRAKHLLAIFNPGIAHVRLAPNSFMAFVFSTHVDAIVTVR